MKRVLSMILALMMVVGVLAVIPMTVGAAETSGWDGETTTTPEGSGREGDPYIIDEPGDLKWLVGKLPNPQVVVTLGYDGKVYAAQYEGLDMAKFNNDQYDGVSFEATYTNKSIDYDAPMALYSGGKYNLDDTWTWGTKIYIKQVCDIDLNNKTINPMCYYWRYSDGSAHVKGQFFCGEYDGQGYTIKNGTVKQGANNPETWVGNPAWTAGLFGVLWGATVKNIVFENFHSVGNNGTPGIGIIASRTLGTPDLVERNNMDATPAIAAKVGKSVVENIKVLGDCTVESKQTHDGTNYQRSDWRYSGTGGIVGAVSNADIKSCVFLGTVYPTLQDTTVGGVVALMGFGATVDGCYFGGKISYEKCTATGVASETHIGGVVGSWRGNNNGCGSGDVIKGTNINNTTTARGVNAITNCVNNGTLYLKATVTPEGGEPTATTITGTVCNGGVLGATGMLYMGSSGSYTFSGNVNLAGEAAIPAMSRTAGIAGCFYNNAHTTASGNNFQKVVMSDCHSVTTTVNDTHGSWNSSTKLLIGVLYQDACVEDDECTNNLDMNYMFSDETIVNAFYKVNNGYFQGEGTEANPWKIGSVADWDFFRFQMKTIGGTQQVLFEQFNGKYLQQTADIDFQGATLTPVSTYCPVDWEDANNTKNVKGDAFRGHYDGQGYALKNAVIKDGAASTNGNWGVGLFGAIYGATLKNMVLDNISVTSDNQVGLLAGIAREYRWDVGADYAETEEEDAETGTTIIKGNYSTTKVEREMKADANVIENIIVKDNCVINANGTGVNFCAGGLVGCADGLTIRNCYVGATINKTGSGNVNYDAPYACGGLVGTMGLGVVENCIANADINWNLYANTIGANNENSFGGIVGAVGTWTTSLTKDAWMINNCFNIGSFCLRGTNAVCVYYGGILGSGGETPATQGGHFITNCYNLSADISAVYDDNDAATTDDASKTHPTMTTSGKCRFSGLVGLVYGPPAGAGAIKMKDCSSINVTGYNYWANYGLYGTNKAEFISLDNVVVADVATLNAAAKAISVDFVKGRDALHYYGAQVKDGANNSKSIRLIYDMEEFTEEELKFFKEIRFNVTMDGKTLTTSENTIYTSFLNYADGEAENLEATEGLKYMTALTINNVPNTGSYEMVVEAMLVSQDAKGAESGIAKAFDVVININNGVVTTTSLGVAAN